MLILDPVPARRPSGRKHRRIPDVAHDPLRFQHYQPLHSSNRKHLRVEHRVRLRHQQRPPQRQARPSSRRNGRAQAHRQHRHPRLGPLHHLGNPQSALQILRERYADQRGAVAAPRNHAEPAQIALQQLPYARNLTAGQGRFVPNRQLHRSRPRQRRNLFRQIASRLLPVRCVSRRQHQHQRHHHRPEASLVDHSLGRIISCAHHRSSSRTLSAKTHLGWPVVTTEVVCRPPLSRACALQTERASGTPHQCPAPPAAGAGSSICCCICCFKAELASIPLNRSFAKKNFPSDGTITI